MLTRASGVRECCAVAAAASATAAAAAAAAAPAQTHTPRFHEERTSRLCESVAPPRL